jgi:hypothetical protein
MDFDSTRRNRPNLIDQSYLNKVIENKKPDIQKPSILNKAFNNVKISLIEFVENK